MPSAVGGLLLSVRVVFLSCFHMIFPALFFLILPYGDLTNFYFRIIMEICRLKLKTTGRCLYQFAEMSGGKYGRVRDCYSFATKYCLCHTPLGFPIYDRNVDKMPCSFGKHDRFAGSRKKDLKDSRWLKEILEKFRADYGLDS